MNHFHLDIVSMERVIYSGSAAKLFCTGIKGELEILFGHAPFFTALIAGPVWLIKPNGEEEAFFISGGTLDVQPEMTIVLADTAIRAKDVDQIAAQEAKERAEKAISEHGQDFNYAAAHAQLVEAIAQLRTLKSIRERFRPR